MARRTEENEEISRHPVAPAVQVRKQHREDNNNTTADSYIAGTTPK